VTSSLAPPPDLVAISATPSGDGIVTATPGGGGNSFFSVAVINIGVAGVIAAAVDDNNRSLPLAVTLCQTNAQGVCLNPPTPAASVTSALAANAIATYTVFVASTGAIPFDPTLNRLFLRFKTSGGETRGATSVAVRTP
jgi:hypothetical protein